MDSGAGNATRSRAMGVRRKKKQSQLSGNPGRLRLALGAIILSVAAAVGLAVANEGDAPAGESRLDAMLTAAGFGIDEVAITGHAMTADSDIFDALDLAQLKTMPALRNAQVQDRLARLPWIATATLTRVYPGRIEIRVTERVPAAVWSDGAKTVLIDGTGRTLSATRATDWPALAHIAGEGAPAAATALLQMLAHFPTITERMRLAERVTQRRWSLLLNDNIRLELPSEGEASALSALVNNTHGGNLLAQANSIIDLRSPSAIVLRPAGAR